MFMAKMWEQNFYKKIIINLNKKLKIIEFENNYSPIATQYNYSDDVISNKKEKIDILNVPKIRLVLMYIIIFMFSAMIRMLITYEITNLGMKKQEIDRHLAELKKETEALEFNYISNYDLKKIEEKAKEMGYVDIDNVTYIDIKK